MREQRINELTEVICNVLETSLFAIGVPCDREAVPADVSRCVRGEIRFDGPAKGRLELAAPAREWAALAADVLACEPEEISEEQVLDVIRELLNVACGQWLTSTFGDAPLFEVSIPLAGVGGDGDWRRLRGDDEAVALLVDERPLLAALTLESGAPA